MEQPFERLRNARIAAGFPSAAAASRAFGWNDGAYRHHENGTRGYGIDQASAYAEAFNVSPAWLLTLGFSKNDAWRLPIGKFYTQALYGQLTYQPGLEEAVQTAHEQLGLFFIPELNVSLSSVDPVRGENDYPRFHFVDPTVVGVEPERFQKGYMFFMRAPRSLARSTLSSGDLLLIDSGQGDIQLRPDMWVIRTFDEILVGWARRKDDGSLAFIVDGSDGPEMPIDPKCNIVGSVSQISRRP